MGVAIGTEWFRRELVAGGVFTRGERAPWQGAHNNHVERTLRPIALGRHNWLFGGSDEGARWLAIYQTLLGTCLLLGVRDPWDYLRDVLTKLSRGWPQSRLGELLPGPWLAAHAAHARPAAPSPA